MRKITLRKIGQWCLVLFLAYFWIEFIFTGDTLFNFEACCPFGGMQAAATFLNNGALSCTMDSMNVAMAAVFVLAVILVSKLFCGYVCPIGTLTEGFSKLGKRLKLPKYEIGGIWDVLLRSLKYILLFITFYFTLQTNDLFCKKFDPFFATVTLFGADVSVWMGVLSIVLVIAGAIFLRQFWCRYLCPLGAISSAFKYFYVFVVFAGIVILLKQADITINSTVLLAILAVLAYVLEIIGLKRNTGVQVLKITRDHTCIDCGLCDKSCPQGIKVSKLKVVNHPDCTMCAECVGVCPGDIEAIGINGSRKFRWVPTLITIALIMTGFILGSNITIPTVDTKWGSKEEINRSEMFEMAGIKNVKCYGSSISFVEKMKRVPGVTGAATYVRDHRVQVLYDTTRLSPAQVRKSLFTSKFLDIHVPENDEEVNIVDFKIVNFFDELDAVFIANTVKDIEGIYSFQTIYGDTVTVRFYTAENFDVEDLKERIEQSNLIYATAEESFSSKDLYTVSSIEKNDTTYSGIYLKSLTFPSIKRVFNNRKKYTNDQLASMVVPIKEYPRNQQMMPYVINHLGNADKFIVGLIANYSTSGPRAIVFYVKDSTNTQNIAKLIGQEKINVTYSNGVIEQFNNPYEFDLSTFLNESEN